MNYEQIKNPKELLIFMEKNIEYGFCDKDGNKYRESDDNFNELCQQKWFLSSPERLLDTKIGHCWDQVEFERDWFLKHNYEIKTIFIMFFNTNLPTHTYLIYKDKDKWYWFEHADFNNKGIYQFNTWDQVVKFQTKRHLEYVSNFCNINNELLKKMHIFEYSQPKYGSNSNEFINFIVDNGIEITNILENEDVKTM